MSVTCITRVNSNLPLVQYYGPIGHCYGRTTSLTYMLPSFAPSAYWSVKLFCTCGRTHREHVATRTVIFLFLLSCLYISQNFPRQQKLSVHCSTMVLSLNLIHIFVNFFSSEVSETPSFQKQESRSFSYTLIIFPFFSRFGICPWLLYACIVFLKGEK